MIAVIVLKSDDSNELALIKRDNIWPTFLRISLFPRDPGHDDIPEPAVVPDDPVAAAVVLHLLYQVLPELDDDEAAEEVAARQAAQEGEDAHVLVVVQAHADVAEEQQDGDEALELKVCIA